MLSQSRIIITGKNRDFPKTVFLPIGVAPDGRVQGRSIQIASDEEKCRRCDGWGFIEAAAPKPWQVGQKMLCPECNGDSIVKADCEDVVLSR